MDLIVDGMWCTACAWVIEKTVTRLGGVLEATCHFSTDRLRCRYRPDRVAPDQIRMSVTRLGYGTRDSDAGNVGQRAQRRELIRLTITGLLSANVMMLSWALYAGFFTSLSSDAVSKISLPIVAMAAVVLVYGGGPMLRKAWFGLIHLAPGMETLVGMAAGCAFVYSLYNWLTGSIHLSGQFFRPAAGKGTPDHRCIAHGTVCDHRPIGSGRSICCRGGGNRPGGRSRGIRHRHTRRIFTDRRTPAGEGKERRSH